MDKVDAKALTAAETAFLAYLRDYPTGAYAASARGLLRRVYWQGRQPQKLAAEYAWQFAHQDPALRNVSGVELVQEVDNKLLAKVDPTAIKEPLLLAVFDLMHMRSQDSANVPKPIALPVWRPKSQFSRATKRCSTICWPRTPSLLKTIRPVPCVTCLPPRRTSP